jgi:glycosyltransferase involved in cell wall biosynthesis
MKKLFIVVNVDWFFLSHRKEIALAAKKDGYKVTIVTTNTGKKADIESLDFQFLDLPINSTGMNILEELKTFFYLYFLYRREKPEIVHHVGLKIILWGSLAAKLAKVKGVVNAVSGLGVFFADGHVNSFFKKILLRILRYSHKRINLRVIFQNNEDKLIFVHNKVIGEEQSVLIKGSGIDLNDFAYTPEPDDKKIKIVLTARMIEEKGVLVFVDAANLLKEYYYDKVNFFLCGGIVSHPKAISEETLLRVCDGEYISWMGKRDDIKEILMNSHIVVLPSYYEGLPKSLIEAAAIGRPIITTNAVGCKDTVIEGYNGFKVPIKDSETLADRLKTLIEDDQLRKTMGRNSRSFAEKEFSIEDVIAKHLKIYMQLSTN